ncbi:hypothetical protein B296_00046803, partial [Ensete ventricosum]
SPEYATEGQISVKSDVYSYVVLQLEIVSGFRNSSFPLITDTANLLAYVCRRSRSKIYDVLCHRFYS